MYTDGFVWFSYALLVSIGLQKPPQQWNVEAFKTLINLDQHLFIIHSSLHKFTLK